MCNGLLANSDNIVQIMISIQDIDTVVKISETYQITNPYLKDLVDRYHDQVSARLRYYAFLRSLVLWLKPQCVIELGVETGLASAFMADGAFDVMSKVIGIDINYHPVPGKELIERYQGTYYYVVGNTLLSSTISQVERILNGRTVGMVFQDSSHHYWESLREFQTYSRLLGANAVWVCDDVTKDFHDPKVDPEGKSMVEYFNEIPARARKLYPELYGVGVNNCIGVAIV